MSFFRSLPNTLAGAVCILLASGASAQTFGGASALLDSLHSASSIADASQRTAALNAIWGELRTREQIPFVVGDSAVFLWRGTAGAVAAAGDHTGWSATAAPLARLGSGDIWARAERFPPEARIDYKLVIGSNWILDPNNPHQQWSGFGPNSELRMPEWTFPEDTVPASGIARGSFSPAQTFASTAYGATVTYRVYTPAGYDSLDDIPVIYITDGQEYSDSRLGALPIVLDNLVARGETEPAILVFIDPRIGGQNLRQEQYVQNPGFATFVAEELVPLIDDTYRTRRDRNSRVILGTSLGGLFSVYLGLQHPDVFGKLAIQSPAFWVSERADWWTGPSIYSMMAASGDVWDLHMTTGTINDTEDGARRMRSVMDARGLEVDYREVPEGHSWGNWRALLDDMLVSLLPPPAPTSGEAPTEKLPLRLRLFPNPSRDFATFEVHGTDRPARIACADTLGREVIAVTTSARGETHAVRVPLAALAPGVYVCSVSTREGTVTQNLTVTR